VIGILILIGMLIKELVSKKDEKERKIRNKWINKSGTSGATF
jgi:hypothetical protein